MRRYFLTVAMALLVFPFTARCEKEEPVKEQAPLAGLFESDLLAYDEAISSPRVVIPKNFDPEQGDFYTIGSAGVQVFASGFDGVLYSYDEGSHEIAWKEVESLGKTDVIYVTGFGSSLVVLTMNGEIYKYHWTPDEARKFLPITPKEKEAKIEKKKATKASTKKVAKAKPGKPKKAVVTKKKVVKKRAFGGRVKKAKKVKLGDKARAERVSSQRGKRVKVKKTDEVGKWSPTKSKLRRY